MFNSYVFLLLFLPACLLALWATRGHARCGVAVLVFGSFVFYGWGSPWYHMLLLAGSIIVNFVIGTRLARIVHPGARRIVLAGGVGFDLALLGYFKYANFFLDQLGFHEHLTGVLLPLGISFYTFTQIAYLVDAYRREAKEYDGVQYALFVTWFPHLIAGPIIHHKEMMPQFASALKHWPKLDNLAIGLSVFSVGLAKKVLIADVMAPFADTAFNASAQVHLTFAEAWIGTLAYTLQIYFDFSGYSDMAIGLSLLFGVRLPINFDSPYKATSVDANGVYQSQAKQRQFVKDYVAKLLASKEGLAFLPAERAVKVEMLRQTNPDCIVSGSSHAMQIDAESAPQLLTFCRHVVNLAVSGGSFEDFLTLAGELVRRSFSGTLVLSVDPWTLRRHADRRFVEEADLYADARRLFGFSTDGFLFEERTAWYKNLVSGDYFARNIKSVARHMLRSNRMMGLADAKEATKSWQDDGIYTPYGSIRYGKAYLRKHPPERVPPGRGRYKIRDDPFDRDVVGEFERIVDRLTASSVAVRFLLTPYHPIVMQCADEHVCETLGTVETYVRDLGRKRGLEVIGSYDPRPLGLGWRDFIDDMHPRDEALSYLVIVNQNPWKRGSNELTQH